MPHRMHDGPAPDGHDGHDGNGHEDEQMALTADEFLTGERIVPHRLTPDMSVADLLDSSFQAYNAGRINEAARLYSSAHARPGAGCHDLPHHRRAR